MTKLSRSKSLPSKAILKQLIPHSVTIAALCFGLTSIRLAVSGRWENAVLCIMMAIMLDGIDGRLARLLNISTDFGAELDSLADSLNFGVAPGLIIYFYALQGVRGGWSAVMFFAICTTLRLARFNINRFNAESNPTPSYYSVGVPAPGGAFIALWPLMLEFSGCKISSPYVFLVFLLFSALLMISKLPSFLFKKLPLAPWQPSFLFLVTIFFVISLFNAFWETLGVAGVIYIGSLPLSWIALKNNRGKKKLNNEHP